MEVTLVHVLVGIVMAALALGVILVVALRSTKPLFPVRCVHCWIHHGKETVIKLSPVEGQWGICPECVGHYWHFSGPEPGSAGRSPQKGPEVTSPDPERS